MRTALESPKLPATAARAALLAFAVLAYASAFGNGWVWDDLQVIVNGRLIGDIGNVPELFLHDSWWNSDNAQHFGETAPITTYRPLTIATFFVERALWGFRPALFHAGSIAIHAGAVLLTFALGMRLGLSRKAAWWGAAAFAVHPAIAEGVHWINGRSDPLFVLLLLGALVLALGEPTRHPRGRAVSIALLVLGACVSKETAFMWMPVVVLIGIVRGPCDVRSLARTFAPFAVGAALALVARGAALHRAAVGSGADQLLYALPRVPLLWRDALVSLLAPSVRLRPSLYEEFQVIGAGEVALAVILAAVLGAGVALLWRRAHPARLLVTAALAAFLLSLAPVAMLTFREGWSGWGRYVYPAGPWVMLAVAALIVDGRWTDAVRAHRRAAGVAGGALIALLAVATCLAGRFWADDEAFARAMMDQAPQSAVPYYALGGRALRGGRHVEAGALLTRCVEVAPTRGDCWGQLALALEVLGRRDDAAQAAARTLALDPHNVAALSVFGLHLLRTGRFDAAANALAHAVAVDPGAEHVWADMSRFVAALGPGSPLSAALVREAARPAFAHVAVRLRTVAAVAGATR